MKAVEEKPSANYVEASLISAHMESSSRVLVRLTTNGGCPVHELHFQ